MRNEPLEELRVQIAAWRKTKKHGDRIPEAVWDRIVAIGRSYPTSIIAKRLNIDFYQLKQRLAVVSVPETSLTCSRIVSVAAPAPAPKVHHANVHPLCEATFPSGIVVRFFSDCESLRTLVSQGRN
jgi:hypothetical protein